MTFNELGEKFADKLADNAILTRENQHLRAERDRLREALKRFADPDNWDDGDERTDWAIIVWDGDGNPIEIARAALREEK